MISPQLAQDMIDFAFMAQTSEDIKAGLNPFAIEDSSKEHHANNVKLA